MLIGLVIFNVSLLLSPALFLEERMELKFGFLNQSGSTGVFITTIRIKSFPRKITAHTLMLLKLRSKQRTPLPSSTVICWHFLIFFPFVLNQNMRGNPPPLQKQPTAQHRHKNKEKQQQSRTRSRQPCKEGDEGVKFYPYSTPRYTMSQGIRRSPAQPSDIRTVGQLHLWLSSSCRLQASS